MASEFVDLVAQTNGVLPLTKGGTGNAYGWAYGTITLQFNNTGSTWPVGSTLAFYPGGGPGGSNPQLTTTTNSSPFIGVVVGTADPLTSKITAGDVLTSTIAAVQVNGIVPMLIDSGNNYGWYVSTGGGAANGHVTGTAGQTAAAVGVILAPSLVQLLSGGGAVSSVGFLSAAVLQAGSGSGVVTTGNAPGTIMVPWACTLASVSLFGDQVGSAVVDIYAGLETVYPPSTSIVSATPPTLAAASHYADSTLTGWTTAFAAHTSFILHVTSCSTITMLTCELVLRQTA